MQLVPFTLALSAGLGYTLSALFSKRALAGGAGIMRIFFVANWMFLAVALPFLIWDHQVFDWGYLWAPLACSLIRFVGLVLIFYTIRVGDVSLQVPIIGTKVIFVSFFVYLLGGTSLGPEIWIATFLTVAGVALMSKGFTSSQDSGRIFKTVVYTLCCAMLFGMNDTIVQITSPRFGIGPFMVVSSGGTALASLLLVPFFRTRLQDISRACWGWLWLGSIVLGVEVVLLFCAISFYSEAAAANIVYNTRSLWSIALVWFLGHWFDNQEREIGGVVMFRRLLGALLLLAAVALVLI